MKANQIKDPTQDMTAKEVAIIRKLLGVIETLLDEETPKGGQGKCHRMTTTSE